MAGHSKWSKVKHTKGPLTVPAPAIAEDRLLEIVIEASGEEPAREADSHVITTVPDQLYAVAEALKQAGVPAAAAKLTFVPQTSASVTDEATAAQVVRLIEVLDESDDVQQVHTNFEPAAEVRAKLSA